MAIKDVAGVQTLGITANEWVYANEDKSLTIRNDDKYSIKNGEQENKLALSNSSGYANVKFNVDSQYNDIGVSINGEYYGRAGIPAELFDDFVKNFNDIMKSFTGEDFEPIMNSKEFKQDFARFIGQDIGNKRIANAISQVKK